MRKYYVIYLILGASMFSCKNDKIFRLQQSKVLNDFPSASAIEYYKGKVYIAGDDAAWVWVGNNALKETGRIRLDSSLTRRVPYARKQDLEAASILWFDRSPALMLFGSGSLGSRNKAFLVNLQTEDTTHLRLDSLYKKINTAGVSYINIEGACSIPGGLLLANRGNKSYRYNHLVYAGPRAWESSDSSEIKLVKLGANLDTAHFNGVSGLAYGRLTDRLFISVSTENTYSANQDGEIGKSYLWIIKDISAKKRYTAINPTIVIDLEKTNAVFKGRKIESVTVMDENSKTTTLLLVADNDDGISHLYQIVLTN